MKRGFSLVELLTTCALIAILSGVIFVAYNNIRNQAQVVAQNRDQVVLQQVIESFRMMGGDLSGILGMGVPASATDPIALQEAAGLTAVLQGTVSGAARTQLGQVGNLLSTNMVLAPYQSMGSSDARAMLVANSANTSLKIAPPGTPGVGFIVVPKDSVSAVALPTSGNGIDAAKSILNAGTATGNAITGAKYASNSSYVWNEDNTPVAGPVSTPTPTVAPMVMKTPSASLSVSISFDGADLDGISKYTYYPGR